MNKIIYLDSAASALKPESVIQAEVDFLKYKYANAGRGVCARAADVDKMVAASRERVARFINAKPEQIVFTSGATDGLNRVVGLAWTSRKLRISSIIAVSDLDHHSARLPWMAMAQRGCGSIRNMPLDKNFNIDLNKIPRADFYVITAMSNVLGVAQDVGKIIRAIRSINPNAITIVDASQYVVHNQIDVKKWHADFICFSGHKIGADTGVGVMYVRRPDFWRPDKFGGGMIDTIKYFPSKRYPELKFRPAPEKFEAGTLPLTQIAGLVPAVDYLEKHRPNLDLIKYMYDELSKIARIKILSPRDATLLTFVVDNMHPLDFGAMAGAYGICLRVGTMCASWIHTALGVDGTIRISVGSHNTLDEAKEAVKIIKKIVK